MVAELTLLSAAHLLVDGICAATLFGSDQTTLLEALMIYNTLAFTTQCLTGMIPDKFGRGRLFVALSALLLAGGALIPMPLSGKAILIGLGNSLFHVSGGYLTLKSSKGLSHLGIFVAPGAIGLFLGRAFPVLRIAFTSAMLLLSAALLFMGKKYDAGAKDASVLKDGEESVLCGGADDRAKRALIAGLLLIAVAARAVGGSAVVFPWKTTVLLGFIMTFFVFLGKAVGGILADRFGLISVASVSVIAASVLIAFFNGSAMLSMAGQFALNLSMPITLYLIYRLYPDSPGFAFGLAASALWPGTLIGKMIELTGAYARALIIICFVMGLATVCIAWAYLNDYKGGLKWKESDSHC